MRPRPRLPRAAFAPPSSPSPRLACGARSGSASPAMLRTRAAPARRGLAARWRASGSAAAREKGGAPGAVENADGTARLHVVFVHPQIHWNTGNIGRTCLGLGAELHLVGPLGFSVDAKQVRRAGLDYWEHVRVSVYDDWASFARGRMRQLGGSRFFFTKFGDACASRIRWPAEGNVVMVFGSEVDGFDGIRDWLDGEGAEETRVAFPMVDERFRSFNLSTTASMALWDAYKQVKLADVAGAGAGDGLTAGDGGGVEMGV